MQFTKIAGPMRLDSTDTGSSRPYRLKGTPGGRMVKTLQYMVKVLQTSGSTAQVAVDVEHGPDGDVYATLQTNVVPWTSATTLPGLAVGAIGAADSNAGVVGEWILPVLKVQDSATTNPVWAVVEVYEMRKPF